MNVRNRTNKNRGEGNLEIKSGVQTVATFSINLIVGVLF